MPLVERFDTSVAELELKYANNKLISDNPTAKGPGDYRKIFAGSIPGSNYYLVGGITELNFNIRSVGASGDGGETVTNGLKGTAGANMYVMNIGLDLRLVDTDTLEVVDVVSYQKQIIGRQISAGVFDFLGQTFFDASLGESALEPIQLAVRSVIERATLEMMSRLYRIPAGTCTGGLNTADDPLGDARANPIRQPARVSTAYATTPENRYDTTRQNPYYGYSSDDPASEPGLRGGRRLSTGSNILNGQVNFNASVSTLNTSVYNTGGDVVGQSVAGGNAVDITTMNDTTVNNNQYQQEHDDRFRRSMRASATSAAASATRSQAACNSASVSTDPTLTAVNSNQECRSIDPSSTINANIANIGGDVGLASSSVGNTFEADSNASNMPVSTKQINTSFVQSKVNTNVANVGGTVSATSAAIGNNAQILHYTTTN